MVHGDVFALDADVLEVDIHGAVRLDLVAVGVVDGHVDRDHVVDALAGFLSGVLYRVNHVRGVNLRGDDVGAFGKRAFGSVDGHLHAVRVVDVSIEPLRLGLDLGGLGLVDGLVNGLGLGLGLGLVNGLCRGLVFRLRDGFVNRHLDGLVHRLGRGLFRRLGRGFSLRFFDGFNHRLIDRLGSGLIHLRIRIFGRRLHDDGRLFLEVRHLLNGSGLVQAFHNLCDGLRREQLRDHHDGEGPRQRLPHYAIQLAKLLTHHDSFLSVRLGSKNRHSCPQGKVHTETNYITDYVKLLVNRLFLLRNLRRL